MNWIKTEKFKIRAYEIGADHRIPIANFYAYMEEAAALHAAELGFSVEDLARKNLAWALSRSWLEFYESPFLGEDVLNEEEASWITLKTWPVSVERLLYRRDFVISWQGIIIAKAVTEWVVINLQSRRAERVPEFIAALSRKAEKVLEISRPRFAGQENEAQLASFTVRKSDIDRNNHVNNAKFIEWVLESTPDSLSSALNLKYLQVVYRAESRYGDTVIAKGSADGNGSFLHALYRLSDGQELLRAKTVWA